MSITPFLLAAFTVEDALARWKSLSQSNRERLVVLTAILLVAVPFAIWALFFSKRRRHRSHHHHHHHHSREVSETALPAELEDAPPQQRRRRKWRRPRRDHRPRNPTLAETGGLPPVRSGGPPEPRD
jgi:hypothetical protein